MKKNLMSILILALLVVNIVLTAIMMFSVTGASKRTSALVTDIASAMNLEIMPATENGEQEAVVVPMEDVLMHSIPDKMTLALKSDEDGSPHYALVSVSFSMNSKDEGYKKYGATLTDKDPILKDIVIDVFKQYTVDDVKNNTESIKQEILTKIQKTFDSEFIFDVAFGEITPQ